MNRSRIGELEHPERTNEMQRKSSQRYYYKNREKVLAKKQQKYAESRGQVIAEIKEVTEIPEPEPEPTPAPEPVEQPKWVHPFFNK